MTKPFDERVFVASGLFVLAAMRALATFGHGHDGSNASMAQAHAHAHDVGSSVVGGLASGDALADLVVEHVGEPRDGAVAVELTDGEGGGVRIWVRARSVTSAAGQAHTDDFDLRYGNPRPGFTMLPNDVALAATEALRDRIAAARPEVPPELR